MFCGNCGNEIMDGGKFCPSCGNPVEDAGAATYTLQGRQIAQSSGKKRKKGGAVAAILLSILVVILCSAASIVHMLRSMVAEDAVDALVKKIDISDISVGLFDEDDMESITDTVLEYSKVLTNAPLTEKEVEKILDEEYVKDFATDKLNDYVNDMLHDTGEGVIKAKDIEKFLENNREDIEEITGYYLTDNDIENISDRVKKDLKQTDLSRYRSDNEFNFAMVRGFMSYPLMIIMILLAVACVVAIALLNSDKLVALRCTGICLAVTGVINLIAAAVIGSSASKLNKVMSLGKKFWNQLLAPAKSAGIATGIVLIFAGAIFIVIYVAVCQVRKSKQGI